jgi:hypothetical protein
VDAALVGLPCKHIQCDESWSFCHAKQRNVPTEHQGEFGYGDAWTWTGLCAETKLVPSWLVDSEPRSMQSCSCGTRLLGLATVFQLTTDGLRLYLNAVEAAFTADALLD